MSSEKGENKEGVNEEVESSTASVNEVVVDAIKGEVLEFVDKNFELHTPDQIWVCDKEAFKIAKSIFNKVKIVQIQNPYIYSIKKELEKLSSRFANKNPKTSAIKHLSISSSFIILL